jgi:hypothetical protein
MRLVQRHGREPRESDAGVVRTVEMWTVLHGPFGGIWQPIRAHCWLLAARPREGRFALHRTQSCRRRNPRKGQAIVRICTWSGRLSHCRHLHPCYAPEDRHTHTRVACSSGSRTPSQVGKCRTHAPWCCSSRRGLHRGACGLSESGGLSCGRALRKSEARQNPHAAGAHAVVTRV